MEEHERDDSKGVVMSLHMIVRRHLPPSSSSWTHDKIVEALNELSHLRLDRENLRHIDHMELFSDRLTNVYLQQNEIERVENLEFVKGIQFLTLSSNRLEQLEGLSHLGKLVFLDVSNNRIHHLDTDELPKSISFLNLKGNPCSQDPSLRQRLLRALPRLKQLDGEYIAAQEKRDAGLDVSSDSDEDDSEDDAGDEQEYIPEDIFSLTSSEILLRSQGRMENALLDHKDKRELLRNLRSAAAEDEAHPVSSRAKASVALD